MKAILKKIQEQPQRTREISDHEKETFSHVSHLQRYFPVMDYLSSSTFHPASELASSYFITEWKSKKEKTSNDMEAIRQSIHSNEKEPCRVFVKTIHLLHPIDYMKEKYIQPSHSLLPQPSSAWKNTVMKLQSRFNQAYVDTLANYLLSRFREEDVLPHFVLYYGSYNGISDSYRYNVSGEYDTYRNYKWFWKGMKKNHARLTLTQGDKTIQDDTRYHEFYQEITSCPFSTEELEILSDSESDASSECETVEEKTLDIEEFICEFDEIQSITSVSSIESLESLHSLEKEDSTYSSSDESEKGSETEESESSLSSCFDVDVYMEIPNIPVIMVLQEAQDGVMDDLLMEDELDGYPHGSQGWESRWLAWIFQIIGTLTFLQHSIQFTHNDLHSNNVLWRKTEKRFLYYRTKDGSVWRVPTFGKIFSIIDFGRSIFRIGSTEWISDDHWPDQDAGDQYNYGPFYDSSKPKVKPNPSFDLCRLSVSMIDGLFDEYPEKKKGNKVAVMSEEGSWKMYETKSPLFNLLWSWTVDDAGRTIYETEEGEEKYDGFDLYIRIAQDVHSAVPKEQLHRPIFHPFLWKHAIPKGEKVYSLDK